MPSPTTEITVAEPLTISPPANIPFFGSSFGVIIYNVEFIHILNRKEINFRVWERGVGETLACGTGACASLVASVLNNKSERQAIIHLTGGDLDIQWADNGHLYMTGPAELVFRGEMEI